MMFFTFHKSILKPHRTPHIQNNAHILLTNPITAMLELVTLNPYACF